MELSAIKHGEAIIRLFLEPKAYIDFDQINAALHISRRTFFYALKKINQYLDEQELDPVQNLKGVGYYLTEETQNTLLQRVKQAPVVTPNFSQDERQILILLTLINHERTSLELTQQRFGITHHTAVSDLKNVKQTAAHFHLQLVSGPTGTQLSGAEQNQRNCFLTLLSEHGPLINSCLDIDPHRSLEITQLLHTLEIKTGNYFSDDTLTTLITFFSWYLTRVLTQPNTRLGNGTPIAATPSDPIQGWAATLLKKYAINEQAEQNFITYLVKSGQFIRINPNNTLAHTLTPIVRQIIHRFNNVSGSQITTEDLELPLLTHLLSTYYRVKYKVTFKQPSLHTIMKQYSELIFFTKLALEPFETFVHQTLSDEEIMLVAIYFGGVLRNAQPRPYTVEVVCSSGIGTSKILYEELHRRYPNVKFSQPISVFQLKNSQLDKTRLIISTIKLVDHYDVPHIVVAPIPTKIQWQQIDQTLIQLALINRPAHKITVNNLMDVVSNYARITDPAGLESAFTSLLASNQPHQNALPSTALALKDLLPATNILIANKVFSSWEPAVQWAFGPLINNQSVATRYVDQIIASTKEHGPYMVFGDGVMLAHARPADGVKKIGMSLLVLKHPLSIHDYEAHQDKPVNIIIGLAPINATDHVTALSQLVKLLQQPQWLDHMQSAPDAQTIYHHLTEL